MHVDTRKVQAALLDIAADIEQIKQTDASETLKGELMLVKVGQRQILMGLIEGKYAQD
jgi:hypothetical protein